MDLNEDNSSEEGDGRIGFQAVMEFKAPLGV